MQMIPLGVQSNNRAAREEHRSELGPSRFIRRTDVRGVISDAVCPGRPIAGVAEIAKPIEINLASRYTPFAGSARKAIVIPASHEHAAADARFIRCAMKSLEIRLRMSNFLVEHDERIRDSACSVAFARRCRGMLAQNLAYCSGCSDAKPAASRSVTSPTISNARPPE